MKNEKVGFDKQCALMPRRGYLFVENKKIFHYAP